MSRQLTRLMAVLVFLAPAVAQAQGLLIVVAKDQQVRLPRPIPRPVPPPVSYKIKELDVNVRLIDQVAPGPGVADVREHRQPADGSGVRVSVALRRGNRADDVAGRR